MKEKKFGKAKKSFSSEILPNLLVPVLKSNSESIGCFGDLFDSMLKKVKNNQIFLELMSFMASFQFFVFQ